MLASLAIAVPYCAHNTPSSQGACVLEWPRGVVDNRCVGMHVRPLDYYPVVVALEQDIAHGSPSDDWFVAP